MKKVPKQVSKILQKHNVSPEKPAAHAKGLNDLIFIIQDLFAIVLDVNRTFGDRKLAINVFDVMAQLSKYHQTVLDSRKTYKPPIALDIRPV
jgi:hypothetical protein